MAISLSSYEIIFPDSRQIVIVNARPGDRMDNRLIIDPSPTNVAMIQCYDDIQSMLYDDGGPAYTTCLMEFKTNHGSVATPISLDGSHMLDHEHSIKIGGNNNEEKEEVVCVICQEEFQMGEMCVALECEHGYHKECIEKWFNKKNDCPICRAKVFPFLSKICVFRAVS